VKAVRRFLTRRMVALHRRQGDHFMDMDVLYLTTVGARSGEQRETPVARFPDGPDAWVVVASANGAPRDPDWYRNLVAHPDQVWVEVGGERHAVVPEVLEGPRREAAWQAVVAAVPRFGQYQKKTDRVLPVIRLARG
jgi:deazaflavin-dependent oxidoreductase (nitroreductase family)